MAVPHILAGSGSGTTAQLDANFDYFARAIVTDASGNMRISIGDGKIRVRPNVDAINGTFVEAVNSAEGAYFPMRFAASVLRLGSDAGVVLTLDATGNVLMGTSTYSATPSGGVVVSPFGGSTSLAVGHVTGTPTGYAYLSFCYNGASIGGVNQNGTTGVTYATTSDHRLKSNQQPLTGSGAFIDALQPKTWEWASDGRPGVGFIAHEVQAVAPGSVIGALDAVDAEGQPVYQSMEYGSAEFIANIVAELQSLRARLAALEA